MAHQLAAMPMTLSDLQGHSPAGSLFKCFSYSYAARGLRSAEVGGTSACNKERKKICAAVDKNSSDIVCRIVRLQ